MLVKVLLILIRVCHSPHFFHIFFNDLYHFVRISALAHPVPHRSTADSFLPALTVRCPHTSRSHCVPRSLCVGVAGRLVSICFPFKHTHVACGQSRSRTRIVCYTQIRKQFASLFFSSHRFSSEETKRDCDSSELGKNLCSKLANSQTNYAQRQRSVRGIIKKIAETEKKTM